MPRIEILSGTGGLLADRWVADLSDLVTLYAHRKGWTVEAGVRTEGTDGGFCRLIIDVRGAKAYARLPEAASIKDVRRIVREELIRGFGSWWLTGNPDLAEASVDRSASAVWKTWIERHR